ncbi:MAG: hypothetical protein ACI8P0_004211 [Planctomycetaceae bacterium]|jgi:hypothetical protein
MRLEFLKLVPEERRLYIEQAALQRNLSPVVMEKDFWVCWLPGILFELRGQDSFNVVILCHASQGLGGSHPTLCRAACRRLVPGTAARSIRVPEAGRPCGGRGDTRRHSRGADRRRVQQPGQ